MRGSLAQSAAKYGALEMVESSVGEIRWEQPQASRGAETPAQWMRRVMSAWFWGADRTKPVLELCKVEAAGRGGSKSVSGDFIVHSCLYAAVMHVQDKSAVADMLATRTCAALVNVASGKEMDTEQLDMLGCLGLVDKLAAITFAVNTILVISTQHSSSGSHSQHQTPWPEYGKKDLVQPGEPGQGMMHGEETFTLGSSEERPLKRRRNATMDSTEMHFKASAFTPPVGATATLWKRKLLGGR